MSTGLDPLFGWVVVSIGPRDFVVMMLYLTKGIYTIKMFVDVGIFSDKLSQSLTKYHDLEVRTNLESLTPKRRK